MFPTKDVLRKSPLYWTLRSIQKPFPWQQAMISIPFRKKLQKNMSNWAYFGIILNYTPECSRNNWSQKVSVFGGCFSSPETISHLCSIFFFCFLGLSARICTQTPGCACYPPRRLRGNSLVTGPTKYQPKPREMECRSFGCGSIFPNMPPVYKQGFKYNYAYSGVATCLSFWPNGAPWTKKNPNYRSLSSALCFDFFWMCLPIPVGGSENLLDQLK